MSYANQYIEHLAELDRSGQPFASVTIVEGVGSTPENVGSKMLVNETGLVFDTVGEGLIERKAIGHAQAMLSQGSCQPTELVEWNLQRDVGMTCGGVIRLFFESFNDRRWQIVIFGAGHVAQALTRYLLPIDCQIHCIDQRHEWLDRLPESSNLKRTQCDEPADMIESLRD